jgi:deoxyribodipyrimidine photo-lyase
MRTTERHGKFLLGGLECVHDELKAKNVPFDVIHYTTNEGEENPHVLGHFLKKHNPSVVVCDTSVLRHTRRWNESPALRDALDAIGVPLYQVDAHNVVPIWYASPKREVGARTLRSKLHKVVDECMQNKEYKNGSIPEFMGNKHLKLSISEQKEANKKFDYESHELFLNWDDSVKSVIEEEPGTASGIQKFEDFTKTGLRHFSMLRNDPNNEGVCSSLSPWFNHGHLSFATCMRFLRKHNRDAEGKASFVEEGFVRRELSDNFLWYAPDTYDTIQAGAQWAQDSLELHRNDPREYIYMLSELESGRTHDDLWNAAQLQMIRTGKMHGFLRMYWAKKILEWTSAPTDALKYAQYLNDKYALDGRDPNGFCGVAWSIFGNHDMGWKEREIFGKIRFMNYNGCKRKFKVDQFVKLYPPAAKNALKAKTDPVVAVRTKKRNRIAAAAVPTLQEVSGSSDDDAPPAKRSKISAKNQSKKKIQTTSLNEDGVEDLSGLTKSAASKKTVKVLKAYLQSKGVSISDNNGKPLLKAGLIDVLMSIN